MGISMYSSHLDCIILWAYGDGCVLYEYIAAAAVNSSVWHLAIEQRAKDGRGERSMVGSLPSPLILPPWYSLESLAFQLCNILMPSGQQRANDGKVQRSLVYLWLFHSISL